MRLIASSTFNYQCNKFVYIVRLPRLGPAYDDAILFIVQVHAGTNNWKQRPNLIKTPFD